MERDFRIFSYLMADDTGFAPNPFHGICTLACCKPIIRRNANKGDWIVGIRGKRIVDNFIKKHPDCKEEMYSINKIIFAMEVTEDSIGFEEYYKKYPQKRPDMKSKSTILKAGDNIYKPKANHDFLQLPSMHAKKADGIWKENPETKEHDLNGKYVLISDNYYYFGINGLQLDGLEFLIKKGPGHKSIFSYEEKKKFIDKINELNIKSGIHGLPHSWPDNEQIRSDYETFRSKCGC